MFFFVSECLTSFLTIGNFLLHNWFTERGKLGLVAKAPWSWGRMHDFCAFFRMGRGIESQSFYFFFVHPIGRGGLAKKKRKSTKVSRNEEMREYRSGVREEGKTGRRFRNEDHDRSLHMSPRGSVRRPGLVSGRLEMKKEDGSDEAIRKF